MRQRIGWLLIGCVALALGSWAGVVNAQDVTTGLVGYYPMDDETTTDQAGGHDGTIVSGGPEVYIDGPPNLGRAMDFTGAGYRVDTGTWNPAEGTGTFSVACWARYAGGGGQYQGIVAKRNTWVSGEAHDHWYIEMQQNDTTDRIYCQESATWSGAGIDRNSPWITPDNPLPIGEWRHICFTFDGTTMRMYLNGEFVTEGGFTFGPLADAHLVYGGVDHQGGNAFEGAIDEVRLYNRALTGADVAALYTWTPGVQPVYPPKNGVDIFADADLCWSYANAPDGATYDLYLQESTPADPNGVGATPDIAGTTDTCYTPPGGLKDLATYNWKVNVWEPNELGGPPTLIEGEIWQFTTRAPVPFIEQQPQDVMVDPGQTAEFTVAVRNPGSVTSYEWHRVSDDGVVGGNSATLSIAGDPANEDSYYCVVTNISGSVQSDAASLVVKRLIAEWLFEDNADDTSGNDFHAELRANPDPCGLAQPLPIYVEGVSAGTKAVLFDNESGADGQYAYGGTLPPLANSSQITVSLWANWSGINGEWQGLIGKRTSWDNPNETYWQIEANQSDGTVNWARNGSGIGAMPALPIGEWTHVCVTYNGSTAIMYRDGVQASSGSFSFGPAPDANVGIGSCEVHNDGTAGNLFWGAIDEVRIWNYALSRFDVQTIYATDSGRQICYQPIPYDFNNDCITDLEDFAILASHYLDCELVPECRSTE